MIKIWCSYLKIDVSIGGKQGVNNDDLVTAQLFNKKNGVVGKCKTLNNENY